MVINNKQNRMVIWLSNVSFICKNKDFVCRFIITIGQATMKIRNSFLYSFCTLLYQSQILHISCSTFYHLMIKIQKQSIDLKEIWWLYIMRFSSAPNFFTSKTQSWSDTSYIMKCPLRLRTLRSTNKSLTHKLCT